MAGGQTEASAHTVRRLSSIHLKMGNFRRIPKGVGDGVGEGVALYKPPVSPE